MIMRKRFFGGKGLTFVVAEWREGTFALEDDGKGCCNVFFCAPYAVYRRGMPPMQERVVRVTDEHLRFLSGETELFLCALSLSGQSWLVPFYEGTADFDEAIALNRPSASIPGLSSAKARPAHASKSLAALGSDSSHLDTTETRSSNDISGSDASDGNSSKCSKGLPRAKLIPGKGIETFVAWNSASLTDNLSQTSSCSISTSERMRHGQLRHPKATWYPRA